MFHNNLISASRKDLITDSVVINISFSLSLRDLQHMFRPPAVHRSLSIMVDKSVLKFSPLLAYIL